MANSKNNDPIAPLKKEMDDIVRECFNGKIPDERTKQFLDSHYLDLLIAKYEQTLGKGFDGWASYMKYDKDEIIPKLEESIRTGKALFTPDIPEDADY